MEVDQDAYAMIEAALDECLYRCPGIDVNLGRSTSKRGIIAERGAEGEVSDREPDQIATCIIYKPAKVIIVDRCSPVVLPFRACSIETGGS